VDAWISEDVEYSSQQSKQSLAKIEARETSPAGRSAGKTRAMIAAMINLGSGFILFCVMVEAKTGSERKL